MVRKFKVSMIVQSSIITEMSKVLIDPIPGINLVGVKVSQKFVFALFSEKASYIIKLALIKIVDQKIKIIYCCHLEKPSFVILASMTTETRLMMNVNELS